MTYRIVPCPQCNRLHGVVAVKANPKPVAAPAPLGRSIPPATREDRLAPPRSSRGPARPYDGEYVSPLRTRYVDATTLAPTPENALAVMRGDITPIDPASVIDGSDPSSRSAVQAAPLTRPGFLTERLSEASASHRRPVTHFRAGG